MAVAKAETPVVNGYFCLPTEAHDNDGLPHILEHLIFLGSEDYPYKEALDYLGTPSSTNNTLTNRQIFLICHFTGSPYVCCCC